MEARSWMRVRRAGAKQSETGQARPALLQRRFHFPMPLYLVIPPQPPLRAGRIQYQTTKATPFTLLIRDQHIDQSYPNCLCSLAIAPPRCAPHSRPSRLPARTQQTLTPYFLSLSTSDNHAIAIGTVHEGIAGKLGTQDWSEVEVHSCERFGRRRKQKAPTATTTATTKKQYLHTSNST